MKVFVGCKQSDEAILRRCLAPQVQLIFWPDLREEHTDMTLMETEGEEGVYIHFSGYKRITSAEIEHFGGRCINVHPAPPEFPGMGGLNWAIYNGLSSFGVTVHLMNNVIDNGRILEVEALEIFEAETVETLSSRILEARLNLVSKLSRELSYVDFSEFLSRFRQSNLTWGNRVYFARELDEMQVVDLNKNSEHAEMLKRIRAFHNPRFPLKVRADGKNYLLIEHDQD